MPITPRRHASFDHRCADCPLRSQCTTAKEGLHLTFHVHDRELIEARKAWRQGDFADDYRRWRPMVERSLAWLVANGNRRVRYRGVTRNHQWLSVRVAAINLRRLINLGLDGDGTTWAIPA